MFSNCIFINNKSQPSIATRWKGYITHVYLRFQRPYKLIYCFDFQPKYLEDFKPSLFLPKQPVLTTSYLISLRLNWDLTFGHRCNLIAMIVGSCYLRKLLQKQWFIIKDFPCVLDKSSFVRTFPKSDPPFTKFICLECFAFSWRRS